jgi:hypothetical protein
MAIQVSKLKSRLSDMKGDISDVDNTLFATWANYINNFCYRYLSGIDPERFISTQAYSSITSGTQALPADFKTMEMDGCGLFVVDTNGNDTDNELLPVGFGSSSKGFYLNAAGEIEFVKVATSTDFKLRYLPKTTEITSVNQYFTIDGTSSGKTVVPEEYMLFLVNFVSVIYDQWDEDLDLESIDDFRFVRTLDEISQNYRRTPTVYDLS